MAEGQTRHKVTRSLAKRAFAPLAHAAVTAGSAFLTRKALQLWREKVQPRIDEKGGRAVAKETLETVAEKAGPVSGPVASIAEKVGTEDTASGQKSSSKRDAERRQRAQRRTQRRRALDKLGSS